jgi:hypothetical protein
VGTVAPEIVQGLVVSTPSGPANGVTATSTATCPAGKSVLGGGGYLSATAGASTNNLGHVGLLRSYPSSANTWTAVLSVNLAITAPNTASVQAYAICTQ